MAALGQTIAVMDRSGKVVSTSKHLINVFKEAKSAYRERKAEVVAGRQYRMEGKRVQQLKAHGAEDEPLSISSRRSSHSKRASQRPSYERHHSSPVYPESQGRLEQDLQDLQDLHNTPLRPSELRRRHTARDHTFTHPGTPSRAMTSPSHIDMDLAYGDVPPPLPVAPLDDDAELKGLVGKVKMLLEEADCVQYSATAIIASLQRNPEAMAAVALTLAEISNLATKMAPGVLAAMRGSAPAVFALLASPQFLIAAAGVGVGVTIVALGGFKIIKKIKARNLEDSGMDEMLEIGGDVNRIDQWRRGIAEVEEQSVGTSVDGEFITPTAAALSQLNLHDGDGLRGSRRKHRRSSKSSGNKSDDTASSKRSSGSHHSTKNSKPTKDKKDRTEKKSRSSPLRLMFS
ncbi:hypothetical protein MMC07_002116 [Pseudocyphellaria aurata]|nr:hypothetical protein [Pseudocyphellaria aurata]